MTTTTRGPVNILRQSGRSLNCRCHSTAPVPVESAVSSPSARSDTTTGRPSGTGARYSPGGSYTVLAPVRRPWYEVAPTPASARHMIRPVSGSIATSFPSDHFDTTTWSSATTPTSCAGQRRNAHSALAGTPNQTGPSAQTRFCAPYTRIQVPISSGERISPPYAPAARPRIVTVSPSARYVRVLPSASVTGSAPPWLSSRNEPTRSGSGPEIVPEAYRSPVRRLA